MPREFVMESAVGLGYEDGDGNVVSPSPQGFVSISWGAGDIVQLSTCARDPETKETLKEFEGYYVDLDRYAINQLIRKLRSARDKAYGKDE